MELEEQLLEGDKAIRFIHSDDWKWAKEKLEAHIVAVDSINTLKDGTFEQIGQEALARKKAQGIVLSWIQEIEGIAEATANYHKAVTPSTPQMVTEFK